MDSAEKIHSELDACIKSINSAGLGKLDPQITEKLDKICAAAAGLGIDQGKKLAENLSTVLKSFKEGKSSEDSVAVRLTALEFYLNSTGGGAATEEL